MKNLLKRIKGIKGLATNYYGTCPNCHDYHLDDEDVCQVCGWPYNR